VVEKIREQVEKRRTFAIISHPDAGKTTLTEKLLLFGGAIREAGTVKGKKTGKYAKSDWMDIEKQRGISVTSSVMQLDYDNKIINQGNTTNKLAEFHLCTPLIISGETKLSDVSIQNRMISTSLTKKNKGDFEIYKKILEIESMEEKL